MILVEVFKNISYIVAFVGILSSLYKFARNIEKRFDRIDTHFKRIDSNLNNNTLMTLKLVIMNEKHVERKLEEV